MLLSPIYGDEIIKSARSTQEKTIYVTIRYEDGHGIYTRYVYSNADGALLKVDSWPKKS